MAGTDNATRRGPLAVVRQWLSGTPETQFGLPREKAAAVLPTSELLWLRECHRPAGIRHQLLRQRLRRGDHGRGRIGALHG